MLSRRWNPSLSSCEISNLQKKRIVSWWLLSPHSIHSFFRLSLHIFYFTLISYVCVYFFFVRKIYYLSRIAMSLNDRNGIEYNKRFQGTISKNFLDNQLLNKTSKTTSVFCFSGFSLVFLCFFLWVFVLKGNLKKLCGTNLCDDGSSSRLIRASILRAFLSIIDYPQFCKSRVCVMFMLRRSSIAF